MHVFRIGALVLAGVMAAVLLLALLGTATGDLLPNYWWAVLTTGGGVAIARFRRPLGIGVALGSMLIGLAQLSELQMEELKQTDPAAYLAKLQKRDTERWLEEMASLDPDGFAAEIERRREEEAEGKRREEESRQAEAADALRREVENREEAARLLVDLRRLPASDIPGNVNGYQRLTQLDPKNTMYAEKFAHYKKRAREQAGAERTAEALVREMNSRPEAFVDIANFSWSTQGFGTIMEVSMTLKSQLPFTVKDLKVRCEHYAPSGTKIDSNTTVIYETIKPKGSLRVKDFNMGFIHAQAKSSSCKVVGLSRI